MLASPDLHGKGGMSKAAQALLSCRSLLGPEYCIHHVATHPATAERTIISALRSVGMVLRAAYRLLRTRPAIVHLFVGPRGSLLRNALLASAGKMAGSAIVTHVHSGDVDDALSGRAVSGVPPRLLEYIVRRTDVLAVLRNLDLDPERLTRTVVVPNPIDLPELDPLVERDIDILFAGRLVPEKGVLLLTELAAVLSRVAPEREIHVAGTPVGRVGEECAERLRDLGNVCMHGWLSDEAIGSLMARTKILISPSLVDSLPMSVLKAAAHGCFVIASPVGAAVSLLTDGRGMLIDGDDEDWARGISSVLAGLSEERCPGADLRRYVGENYSPDTVVRALRQAYDAALTSEG